MAFNISTGFLVGAPAPLDAKSVVANIAARNAIPPIQRYEGLAVFCALENTTYQLIDGILDANWAPIYGALAASPTLEQVTTSGKTTLQGIIFSNLGTATSSLAEYASSLCTFQSSSWNGSAAVTGTWAISAKPNSEVAGRSILDFDFGGSNRFSFTDYGDFKALRSVYTNNVVAYSAQINLLGNISNVDGLEAIRFGNQETILNDATNHLAAFYNGPTTGYGLEITANTIVNIAYVGRSRTGTGAASWRIVIDHVGTNPITDPSTFSWQYPVGVTRASGVPIAVGGASQAITYGSDTIRVAFASNIGHTLGTYWQMEARLADKIGLLSIRGGWMMGASVNEADFSNAISIISNGDTSATSTYNIGLVTEAVSSGAVIGAGHMSFAKMDGNTSAFALWGEAYPSSAVGGGTGTAVGVYGRSIAAHANGNNVAVQAYATGGLNNYSFYGLGGNIYNKDPVYIGNTYVATDYPNAMGIFSRDNVGAAATQYRVGVVGEAVAAGSIVGAAGTAVGVFGNAKTSTYYNAYGVLGRGYREAAHTTDAIGVYGSSTVSHSAGDNVAFYGQASGSTASGAYDYFIYGFAGDVSTNGKTIHRPASLLSFNNTTLTPTATVHKVGGSGGARSLNSTTAITSGIDGQILILKGDSNTNTLTVPDGANTRLAGNQAAILGDGDVLTLMYSSSESDWVEVSRSNNGDAGTGTAVGSVTLADEATYSLPIGVGQLSVWVSTDAGVAPPSLVALVFYDSTLATYNAVDVFHWGSVVWGATTDTNLCVYWSANRLVIKNRLGSTKTIRYVYNYMPA